MPGYEKPVSVNILIKSANYITYIVYVYIIYIGGERERERERERGRFSLNSSSFPLTSLFIQLSA